YDSFACRLAPVRDRYGLTYGIYSRIVDPEFPYGPWSIELSVNPENVKRALEIVKKIVGEFDKGGISPGELAKEKSHLAGAYLVGLRSPRALARKICEYEQLGLPLKNLDNFRWRLSKITLKDVNEAIRKHFDVTTMQVSLSGTLD
ncbi:MAG TPA: insulinase family protein, partial [Candidatus Obscuribacter sp.]|nr:insulinase family protein [Candidatus Obscuribacter sp.]